jgi:DNA-binding LacI/PurR family transcriptional regulator
VDIGEVARRAGVSRSTVSYALSGKRAVSAATRERVNAVIAEVGYRPSATARALKSGRTDTLALVIPGSGPRLKPSSLPFVAAVLASAEERGLDVLVSTASARGGQEHLSRLVVERRVDGVIAMETTTPDPTAALLHRLGATFVTIGRTGDSPAHDWVDADTETAIGSCLLHLAQLGHRRVDFVNCDPAEAAAGYGHAVNSATGFWSALAGTGVTGDVYTCAAGHEHAVRLGRRLLSLPDPPTALISVNDAALVGLADAFRGAGLSVPADLSVAVVVVQDALPVGLALPLLTGVDVPVDAMASGAVDILCQRLKHPDLPAVRRLLPAPPLVLRHSTAAPRSARRTVVR